MTTLNSVPYSPDEHERLLDVLRSDHNNHALGRTLGWPACPQGGTCECPNAKEELAKKEPWLGDHRCSSDMSVRCIVLVKLCPHGTYSATA